MKFKEGALPTDHKDRIAYLVRFQRLLIDMQNAKGEKYRNGEITQKQFHDFKMLWAHPRFNLCADEIAKCKQRFKADLTIPVTITDIEED